MSEMFSTEGRANRSHYFWHTFLDSFVMVALIMAALFAADLLGVLTFFIAVSIMLAGVWAEIAVTVKRLHDLDRPGWHWLLLGIPVYNIYLELVLLFKKGTDGPNQYGDDPVATQSPPVMLGKPP